MLGDNIYIINSRSILQNILHMTEKSTDIKSDRVC